MPRAGRSFEEGRTYHLYNCVAGGRIAFEDDEFAEVLEKSRDGVSRWMRRGAVRRVSDPEFSAAAQALDHAAWEEP